MPELATNFTQNSTEKSIFSIYEELKSIRNHYTARGMEYSGYTIRSILPALESTDTSGQTLSVRFNTIGPMLVNHLANKYVTTLFPAIGSFFKLDLEEEAKEAILKSETNPGGAPASLVEYALAMMEQQARKLFDKLNSRPTILEAMKHLIVVGNCLLLFPEPDNKKGKVQLYALDEYVIRRDLDGNVLEIITRDSQSLMSLGLSIRMQVAALKGISKTDEMYTATCDLYTRIALQPDGDWLITQAVDEVPVGETVTMKDDDMRWIPMRWNSVRREVYGRGHVEDYSSVFYALEVLNEAITTGTAISLDLKFLVDPTSVVDIHALNNSANGSYHFGKATDVSMIDRAQKGDLMAVGQLITRLEQILRQAFLFNTPRDSERTTAEEVRLMANELETSHGGVFGELANTLQRPIATLLIQRIDGDIKGTQIEPQIVTGLDAMGRGSMNDLIMQCFNAMQNIMQTQPEVLEMMRVDPGALFAVVAANYGVKYKDFTITEEEANRQAQQKAEAEKKQMQDEAQMQGATPEQIQQVKEAER